MHREDGALRERYRLDGKVVSAQRGNSAFRKPKRRFDIEAGLPVK
jgi:hypothetical protein